MVERSTIKDTQTRAAIHHPSTKLIAYLQIKNQNDGKQSHKMKSTINHGEQPHSNYGRWLFC
jgi:hypothetical protein